MALVTFYTPSDMLALTQTGTVIDSQASSATGEVSRVWTTSGGYFYGNSPTVDNLNRLFLNIPTAIFDTNDDQLNPNFIVTDSIARFAPFSETLLNSLILLLAGNDRILGSVGVDNLAGFAGNDTYVITNGDTIVDSSGNDTAESSVISLNIANYASIENLKLTGALTLSATGDGGANILDGSTNTAVNALTGLGNNDTYVLGLGDIAIEAANAGLDTAQSSVRNINLALAAFANIENATLTGAATLTASGTAGANVLSGALNSAANTLTGLGGNDTYDVGVGDKIVEATNGGSDTVRSSSLSLKLANYANVENITLLGSAAFSATGNANGNVLSGELNSAHNVLVGLAGNDTYNVGVGDTIMETATGGVDTVRSSTISVSLANYLNVENVSLLGTAALTATGNGASNTIIGNSGANFLSGGGGNDTINGKLGGDQLTGGAGLDKFVFDTALSAGNIDIVTDFNAADDTIELSKAIFTAFAAVAPGTTLPASAFFAASAASSATTAAQRIIYDTSFGGLYYDPDGFGGASSVQIGFLGFGDAAVGVSAADFVII